MSRVYTPDQRQEALDAYTNHGAAEAARRTGIPAGTIASWAHRAGIPAATPDHLRATVERGRLTAEERRQQLADRLLALTDQALDQLRAALADASARDAAVIVGILIDKAQLLTGQATERIDHRGDLDREIEELLSQVAAQGS